MPVRRSTGLADEFKERESIAVGPQLSRDEIAQIRRFIIEERRRTPRSTERELWERTQERFTDFRYLTNANFRYHYRQLNEASRQQGIEIGDLDPEVHGRSGRDQRSQSLHGLDGLRQQLLLAKKAEAGARQELEARV